MSTQEDPFQIGMYRPVYLWGGPGTIRMNRLKFMNQPVDEAAHHQVHAEDGARIVLEEMYCNWVHLTYDWGFPPEIEQEDWEDFRRAAAVYHRLGSQVFAYIQTLNCVYDGSFRGKDWYARDPRGRKIFYYSGRYMTCPTHPAWIAHLKEMIRGAIERGADGIFFDNMWHGAMPISMSGAWLGAAGCHCPRCQEAYRQTSGWAIPTVLDPDDENTRGYLRYRADQVTALIAELADFARALQPGTPLSANDFIHYTNPTYVVYGQDIGALSEIKEVTMIENFALTRWERHPQPRLANNALAIRNVLAAIRPQAHLSMLSYDVGIGFDSAYTPRRYQQGIAESAACGASMTTKGTEYFVDGAHTTLTPQKFAPIQQAIGKYNRWLEAHRELYSGGVNLAPVGLLFPGDKLWLHWQKLAALYQGAGQTLTVHGIPWRVVNMGDDLKGLAALLVFDPSQIAGLTLPGGISLIQVPEIPGWQPPSPSWVARHPLARSAASGLVHGLMDAYFSSKLIRQIFDGLGLPKLITQSMVFKLPPQAAQAALLSALPPVTPRVEADEPVLIEIWQRGGSRQIHLVNYAEKPQTIKMIFGGQAEGRILSPEGEDEVFDGAEIKLDLGIYKVLVVV